MLGLLANGFVIAGVLLLVAAILVLRRLLGGLPTGAIRRGWLVLVGLIFVFVAGYLAYLAAFHDRHWEPLHLIVPVVFLLGACFVLLVSVLALRTANELRRVARLERENVTDPLTGLHNRRYLERRLNEEFVRSKRYSEPLAVILLDIDHFKRINDRYGHVVGDDVLRNLGEVIRNTARATDLAARYGGEEFIVIAVNTEAEYARALAERLRHAVEAREFALGKEAAKARASSVTVSVGVANLANGLAAAQELVEAADQALYQAKEGGRNRVVIGAPANA